MKASTRTSSLWSAALLLLAMLLVLSACGGGNNTPAEEPAAATNAEAGAEQPADPPAEETQDQTRQVEHAMETTELTGTPERVVVLTQEGTEALLELGVTPVGAVNSGLGDGWFPHIADQMEGVTELGDESQPNLELILSLQPDLIIGNKIRHEEIYSQLKEIAPTVLSADLAGQWKVNFALYSEAVNKQAEGEQAMADYDAHIEEATAALGDKTQLKVSLVRFLPETVRIYQKDTFAGTILSDLGVARPESQDVDNFMEVIEKERIEALDGDVMFFFNADYDEEKGGTKNQQAWMADPLFANLNVGKNDTAFQVDEVIWNLSGGIMSANLLIDQIVEKMEAL
ncbi:ABC transporter substrate-binding protein [Paenibacillus daejeonensis]|uniref:ABC transporter substrate-binding protein n=1 Tax=Paenibacillus daejeonensis TaxID=135193 RepID=UPI0003632E2A|nr:iron-siderophore ABC transporter substrate-binding protein [Paenibacillus daejeonensis]